MSDMSVKPLVLLTTWAQQTYADMVLTPETRRVLAHESHPVGAVCGIYGLFRHDALVYVGKSKNLDGRLRRHYVGEHMYESFACLEIPEHLYSDVEISHIHALKPKKNRLYEPCQWEGHAAMVEIVRAAWGKA